MQAGRYFGGIQHLLDVLKMLLHPDRCQLSAKKLFRRVVRFSLLWSFEKCASDHRYRNKYFMELFLKNNICLESLLFMCPTLHLSACNTVVAGGKSFGIIEGASSTDSGKFY